MFKKLFNNLIGNTEEQNDRHADEQRQEPVMNVSDEDNSPDDEVEFDPETLHGTHYTVEAFDKEVETRSEAWIKDEKESGENLSKKDIDNIYFNYRREVYREWTGADTDQMIRWELANSIKHSGIATSGFVKEDAGDNPLLEPIHGISLKDYAAMAVKMSQGIDYKEVCKAMGIEPAVWEEINTLWPKRMQEDSSFTVTTLYGQYFMEGANHPKLQNLQANISEEGKANLKKLKTDRYFYEELCGARQAAYEYGLDGAQWIADNYGITLGDFQAVAMQWMNERNKNFNSEDIHHFQNYQEEKQKEYAAKFAAEQGGNVADDVEF